MTQTSQRPPIDWARMHALTLWRPWTVAIFDGPKRIENRPTLKPPGWLVGQWLALHGGRTFDATAEGGIRKLWPEYHAHASSPWGASSARDAEGLLGIVRIVGCVELVEPTPVERRTHPREFLAIPAGRSVDDAKVLEVATNYNAGGEPWLFGRYGIVFDSVRKLKRPIPCRGHQGLWPIPPEAARAASEVELTPERP